MLPDCLAGALKQCLGELDLASTEDEQCTGLRIELAASFIYRASVTYRNRAAEFFVMGCQNTVVANSIVRRKRTWMSRFTDKFEVTKAERQHVHAVQTRSLFLTDFHGFGQQLRDLGFNALVSDRGYVVPEDERNEIPEIQICFEYDPGNVQLIRTLVSLGEADRFRFPEYLACSQYLAIGLIGLKEAHNRSVERLMLTDSRRYALTTTHQYHAVLQLLALDARRLKDTDFQIQSGRHIRSEPLLRKLCGHVRLNVNIIAPEGQVTVTRGNSEALLNFSLFSGRRQFVLLKLISARGFTVIEMKSRCRVAETAVDIRESLTSNLNPMPGGFSLDTSTNPPSIDLVSRIIWFDDDANYHELVDCLHFLVLRADAIERRFFPKDRF
jgi:hypothetical protein